MAIMFDNDRKAIIEPERTICKAVEPSYRKSCPKIAVTCFSADLFKILLKTVPNKYLFKTKNASHEFLIYEILINDMKLIAYASPVGAPACVALFEEIIALGVTQFFVFGTCGVLSKDILDCSIIIPTVSVREEGTSYHYAESGDEIDMDSTFILDFEKYLIEKDILYTKGKNWTTDAIFRETKNKVENFRKQEVISVDMEASALRAVTKFRGVNLLQFFYAADNLDTEEWDERSFSCENKIEEKAKIWKLLLGFILSIKEKLL